MTTNGCNGTSSKSELQWKVGLINSSKKYLTAESFGFKINVSGTTLKKKQTFILEQDSHEDFLYIRSHTGRYLSSDKYGNVTCETEAEERTASEKFSVEYDKNGSGRWAFRNLEHGNYLGGSEDNFKCFSKSVTEADLWIVQLSIHPQVNLRNVNRKRYAHLKDEQLQVTEVIPWGQEALIILHFEEGKYALKTYDNRFLNRDGTLSADLTDEGRYTLEIRSGANSGLAFKDVTGTYLTAVGATATMKGRNKTVSKDELFTLEDSCPQVILTSLANNKKVSTRQGVDVTANQDDEEDTDREIFQMELVKPPTDDAPGKWGFRTVDNTYWTQEPLGGIQATARDRENTSALFVVEWQGDGTIGIKANNGSYVQSRQTGQLVGLSDSLTNKEKFYVKIINRPLLLLKNEHGFVGLKSPKNEVQCSKTNYEVIFVEPSNDGHYFLKGTNGKYWRVQEDASISADGDNPEPFLLEPKDASILTIKASNGCFIKGEHNGLFRAVGQEVDATMLWEY
ncbi:fascin [Aplysia californica]|uniref:Fascin n=1 Tax=Aplysia californica TaxID=6500 RepID=A0ABM0K3R8_APLCA|nr:fascin [Aplysia californica]XP_005110766.3 fascin [Aplysia californica]